MAFSHTSKGLLGGSFKNQVLFVVIFLGIFAVSFFTLYFLGLIPSELAPTNEDPSLPSPLASTSTTSTTSPLTTLQLGEEPLRIVIPEINVDSPIRNPASTDAEILDAELLKGVVHYPGSGFLGEGNMFLFGHGSGLSVVHNQAYKVFTLIKNLKAGDKVHVFSKTKNYTYTVRKVTLLNASDALIDFSTKKNMLTLSTCNTFGAKQERYVVEADLLGSADL